MGGIRNVPMRPEEAPKDNTILHYDRQEFIQEKSGRQQKMLRILGECPHCHKQRWIRVNSFRNGKTKSTVCPNCARKHQPHAPAKGTQMANGYRMINIAHLPESDRELAQRYLRIYGGRNYVYEHRLVALKTYGPSAVAPGVVIRHINGDKLDNRPENLIPGMQSDNARDHVEAIAEMEAWRYIALTLIRLWPK